MIIYVHFNSHRKKQYLLQTQIAKQKNELVVYKIAGTKEAVPFLNNVVTNYHKLAQASTGITILEPKIISENKIMFPFIVDSISFENHLFESLQNDDRDNFIRQVNKFNGIIKSFPVKNTKLTSGFKKLFKVDSNAMFECINPGIIDINPSNILITPSGEYILIDYEWMEDFPVPVEFILIRAMIAFYNNFKCYNPSQLINLNNLFQIMGITKTSQQLFIKCEYNFQEEIVKDKSYLFGGYRAYKAYITQMINGVNHDKKKTYPYNMNVLDEIEKKDKLIYELSKQYQSVINSKSFRLAQFIAKLKKIIFKD